MKRVWIGAGLLAALLTVGLLAGWAMSGICPGAKELERAGELAMAGRWEAAEELVDEVEDRWEDRRWLTTALSDHQIIDDVEASFAQLEAYAEARDEVSFHALCNALAKRLEAAGKAHTATAENFF